jgi:uncharacterized membrane protein
LLFYTLHSQPAWIINKEHNSYIKMSVTPFNSAMVWFMVFNATFRRGRDRMVVGFTTTYAISAYHHWSCEFEPRSLRGVLDTTLCDKVCQ